MDRIASTWAEIGWRARPLRKMVFVRTEPRAEKEGSIWLLPKERLNYTGLAHQVFLRALVLSTGPTCKVLKTGDRVAFQRLFFARWHEMSDGTLTGWIDEDNIAAEDLIDYSRKS